MAAKTQQYDLLLVTDRAAENNMISYWSQTWQLKTQQHDLLLATDMAAENTTA